MGKFDPTPGPWNRVKISREDAIKLLCDGGEFVDLVGKQDDVTGKWQVVALLPHHGEYDDRDETNAELVRSAYCLGPEPQSDIEEATA